MKIKAGDVFEDGLGKLKVMAVVGGYAMCCRPSRIPFILGISALERYVNLAEKVRKS